MIPSRPAKQFSRTSLLRRLAALPLCLALVLAPWSSNAETLPTLPMAQMAMNVSLGENILLQGWAFQPFNKDYPLYSATPQAKQAETVIRALGAQTAPSVLPEIHEEDVYVNPRYGPNWIGYRTRSAFDYMEAMGSFTSPIPFLFEMDLLDTALLGKQPPSTGTTPRGRDLPFSTAREVDTSCQAVLRRLCPGLQPVLADVCTYTTQELYERYAASVTGDEHMLSMIEMGKAPAPDDLLQCSGIYCLSYAFILDDALVLGPGRVSAPLADPKDVSPLPFQAWCIVSDQGIVDLETLVFYNVTPLSGALPVLPWEEAAKSLAAVLARTVSKPLVINLACLSYVPVATGAELDKTWELRPAWNFYARSPMDRCWRIDALTGEVLP